MGISSDIMHDFAGKEIRAIYSSYDGWKITPRRLGSGYDTLYVLERRNNGHRECVRILASFENQISESALAELRKTESSSDGTLTRYTFAVMVPAHADTAAVPAGIVIHIMKSFAFEGKELAWVKKPVRKPEVPGIPA